MQPIQMVQCPLIAQQALDFAPTIAVQLPARLVECGLRGLPAIESPLKLVEQDNEDGRFLWVVARLAA